MLRLLAWLLLLPLAAGCTSIATAPALRAAAAPSPAAFVSDRISVEVRGSGSDVVLIPGLGSHPEIWESTIAGVPGYRYHLVHVAGFAGKPAGANATGPVVAPVAEEITRYIREAGLERPALVGHSLGGSWAMMIAARHPALVSRLMVVDMIPFLGLFFGQPDATAESLRSMAEPILQGFTANDDAVWRAFIEQQVIGTSVRDASFRPRLVERMVASDRRVVGQAYDDILVTDLRPELANIRAPMTVLWVHAPSVPIRPEQMEQAYANAPHAVITRIPDAWHFIMHDQPEVFQRELRAFLAAR